MKRNNIKQGTIYIILFCIVAFILILVFRPSRIFIDTPVVATSKVDPSWIDSLSNNSSDFELLYPMEKDIERFMSKWDIKGMSVAVMRNDSLLFAKGLGFSDVENGEKMEANTTGRIASASKLITAAGIMKLVENNKISLESKIFGDSGILNNPEFTTAAKDPRVFDITVEDLLRHRGGFTLGAGDPMFNTVEIIKAKRLAKNPTNEELVKIVLGRRLGFQPGSGSRYSNFGYMLLSLVIEKVTGKSYWDYIREDVMTQEVAAGFHPATNYLSERKEGETRYYSPDAELVEEFTGSGKMVDRCYGGANINGLMGAGGWCASAASLARFVSLIDGNPKERDLLSAESVERMTAHGEDEMICFGWTDSDGKGVWKRSGTLSSAHALIMKFTDNECWVLTTNSGVWTGYHFTRSLEQLVSTLRSKYSPRLPRRDLFSGG